MPDSPVEVPLPTPSMEALSSETHALGEILREQHILPRRNAEEGFRESEERYRIVVENSSDGIVILTAAQTFLYANPKCLQIFGYAHKEEILGASVALESIRRTGTSSWRSAAGGREASMRPPDMSSGASGRMEALSTSRRRLRKPHTGARRHHSLPPRYHRAATRRRGAASPFSDRRAGPEMILDP